MYFKNVYILKNIDLKKIYLKKYIFKNIYI